jgi:hypothetical protein
MAQATQHQAGHDQAKHRLVGMHQEFVFPPDMILQRAMIIR